MQTSGTEAVESQWHDLLDQFSQGLPEADVLVGVDKLLAQLDAEDELAYRIRLHAIYPRVKVDPAAALDEYEALLRMREANPAYPQHPYGEGNWFQVMADIMVWWLSEKAGRAEVERLLALAQRAFDDAELLRHLQINAYTNLGEGAKAIPLLRGYLPPEEAVHGGQMNETDWLHRYDLAAMAYLQEGMLAECNATVEAMLRSGFTSGNQPVVMVAESLLPLAQTVDAQTSVRRSLYVLEQCFADPDFAEASIQTASFLLLGGLPREAFNLVHFTEPFIKRTPDVIEELYRFFRFADDAGYGDHVMVRYTSPRWQMEVGTGASARCADLADAFERRAYAEAVKARETTGSEVGLRRMRMRFEVPQLDPDVYANTVAGLSYTASTSSLRFLPVGYTADSELAEFASAALSQDSSFDLGTLPQRVQDDPHVSELWDELVNSDFERAQPVMRRLVEAASNEEVDPFVRQVLEVFLLVHAGFPNVYPGSAGIRALPLALEVNPVQAVVQAIHLLDEFGERDGHLESPEAHDIFDFLGGLIRAGAFAPSLFEQMVNRAVNANRSMDVLAYIDAIEEALAIEPELADDVEATLASFRAIKGIRLGKLGNPFSGAQALISAALVMEERGNMTSSLANWGTAANVLLDNGRLRQTESLFEKLTELLDDSSLDVEPWAKLEAAKATCRFIAGLAEPSFSELWPHACERVQHLLVQVIDEDEDAPDMMGTLANVALTVTRELTWGDHHAEAIEFSAWARGVFGRDGETHQSLRMMGEHAMALGNAGRSEDSALVFESMWQRARDAGATDLMDFAVGYLSDFAGRGDLGSASAYADVLQRLQTGA